VVNASYQKSLDNDIYPVVYISLMGTENADNFIIDPPDKCPACGAPLLKTVEYSTCEGFRIKLVCNDRKTTGCP
jgi:hypothetical protein